jgi:hypothetical protein
MNLLRLVGPWLDNICQIRRKWYYLSVWNFLQSNPGLEADEPGRQGKSGGSISLRRTRIHRRAWRHLHADTGVDPRAPPCPLVSILQAAAALPSPLIGANDRIVACASSGTASWETTGVVVSSVPDTRDRAWPVKAKRSPWITVPLSQALPAAQKEKKKRSCCLWIFKIVLLPVGGVSLYSGDSVQHRIDLVQSIFAWKFSRCPEAAGIRHGRGRREAAALSSSCPQT